MTELPRLRAGDENRDRVLRILADAHAAGRLDADELAERQDATLASRFTDELDRLVQDLPEASADERLPATRGAASPAVGEPVISGMSVMSGSELRPARGTTRVRRFLWWGGDDIDLTDCLGPGITVQLDLVAVMAGSNIHVPPGVRVVDNITNVMAGNSVKRDAQGDGSNGTLVLNGFSWWAGHDVKLAD